MTKLRRLVEAAVLGTLPARKRGEVVAHLRSDEALRAEYDRAIEAFRVLEGRDVAEHEYDLVESWLFDGAAPVAEVTPERRAGWLRFFGVMLAVAAGLLLALGPLRPQPQPDDGFAAKGGGYPTFLAIQALCPRGDKAGLVPATQDGCALEATLSFAYRLDPRASVRGSLSLFAVDEHGDVLYYQPTPVDTDPWEAVAGPWRPLPMAVNLDVNHEAGGVTLYGLVSPDPVTVEDIDEIGALLSGASPARPGERPWHQRIRGQGRIGTMCAPMSACESAELSFYIHGSAR